MSLPGDLYRSFDGFLHRNVDRLGKRIDERDDLTRASVGLRAMRYSVLTYATVTFPSLIVSRTSVADPIDAALVVANLVGPYALESELAIHEQVYGPNEVRSTNGSLIRDRGRFRRERFMRAIRGGQAVLGVGWATAGAARTIESLVRGAPDLSGLHDVSVGLMVAAPPFSSYLPDRDPLAAAKDPMLAYLPEKLKSAPGAAE